MDGRSTSKSLQHPVWMTPSNGKIYANFKTTLYQLTKIPITPTTCKEVVNAIEKLNTGKSADENGIQAEHFRNAKEELTPLLCEIINQILQDLDIPDSMKKSGILTPIQKKGKDKNIPENYRGIVVTIKGVKIFFFVARIFFPEFNIRLYDKNSQSDYFFFPPPK